jgi:hypothetical protein
MGMNIDEPRRDDAVGSIDDAAGGNCAETS